MKVETTTVTKLTISDAPGLDTITVFLEDQGPRKGKVTITCWRNSWTAGWGGMGDRPVRDFILACDNDYLVGNLAQGMRDEIYDLEGLPDHARNYIISERKKRWLDKERARSLYESAEILSGIEHVETLRDAYSGTMCEIFGDEWWHSLPTKANPDYTYLCRIIDTVKKALAGGPGEGEEEPHGAHQ